MQPSASIRKLFPGGNTAQGFHSFYDFISPPEPNRVYIIKGGPGTGKSTLMREIGLAVHKEGFAVELHMCSSDNDSLDAVALPSLKVSVLDGTSPHVVDPKCPGAIDEIINLGSCWDTAHLRHFRQPISRLYSEISHLFAQAYHYLRAANQLLEEREGWIKSIQPDWKRKVCTQVSQIARQILEANLSHEGKPLGWPGGRHLFASAISPQGVVNTLASLVDGVERLVVIRGSLRSARILAVKTFGYYSLARGYHTEMFHCSLRPQDIEHLIIQPISLAIFSADWYLDLHLPMNLVPIEIDLDRLLNVDSQQLPQAYSRAQGLMVTCLEKGIELIHQAKERHDELEQYYIQSMDFAKVREYKEAILNDIHTIMVDGS